MKRYEVLKPACYSLFSCKGGQCRFNCCNSWKVSLSKEEYKKLKKLYENPNHFFHITEENQQTVSNYYQIALKENGDCPFLNDKKLCSMQLEHGTGPMPATCQEFPHFYHEYLHKLELGLSPGCEKVLELLYEEKNGLQFSNTVESIPDYQRFVSIVDEKFRLKYPALIYYYDIQSLCLSILQAEDACLEDRMILLGMAIHRIDTMVNDGKQRQIPAYITNFLNDIESIDAVSQLESINNTYIGVLCSNLDKMQSFITFSETPFHRLSEKITEKLELKVTFETDPNTSQPVKHFSCPGGIYETCQERFQVFIKGKEHFLENMVIALLFYSDAPFHDPAQGIWKDYTYFVWTYTMIKFAMTVLLDETSTVEDMIDCCTVMVRKLSHNRELYEGIIGELAQHQNNSVAHMAMFLKSC